MHSSSLADIIFTETSICDIDPHTPSISYFGKNLCDLVTLPFEEILILFTDSKDSPHRLESLWERAYHDLTPLFSQSLSPLQLLQRSLDQVDHAKDPGDEAFIAYLMTAAAMNQPGAFHTAHIPKKTSIPARILWLLHHREPTPPMVKALNTYLITMAEHGMNTSTFVARVVASTGATTAECLKAALSALSGPLHGGAPAQVLSMFEDITINQNAATFVSETLSKKQRIMGIGHKVYKKKDPRCNILADALAHLPKSPELVSLMHTADVIEKTLPPHLPPNVEYRSSLLLRALDIPKDRFTSFFALGRILGLLAHIKEQRLSGSLVSPKSIYKAP